MDTYDYVIIGAGSAGSVLANRLSEDPDTTICVLEAGPPDWNPYIHIPAGFLKTITDPNVNCFMKLNHQKALLVGRSSNRVVKRLVVLARSMVISIRVVIGWITTAGHNAET